MIVKCPKCTKLQEVPNEKLGKKEVCEHCEHIFVVDDSVIYKEPQPKTTTQAPQPAGEKKVEKVDQSVHPSTPKKQGKNILRVILIILVIIIGIPTAIFVVRSCSQSMREAGIGGILPPETHQLVSQTINVPADNFWFKTFSCPNNAQLKGTVRVESKDVNVWLIEGQNNFNLFKQKKEFYYMSSVSGERVSQLDIDCTLNEGNYYFIVDNIYSIFTSKTVTIDLSLIY